MQTIHKLLYGVMTHTLMNECYAHFNKTIIQKQQQFSQYKKYIRK